MADIVTRAGKGSPLTYAEVDDNFTNLNSAKLEISGGDASATVATAAGSTMARTLAARAADVVNVKDFGAVGNGATDDTAAVQAALNIGSNGVYFPSGNYLVSSVSAKSNTLIYGDGKASQLTASGTGNILVISGVSGGAQIENVTVQNLSFLGLNNMSAGPLGCGIIVLHAVNVTVDQCYFDSFGPGVADTATGGAALCFYTNCVDVTASNNTVVNGTGYLNGTDIAMYSAAGYGIVTGNRTYSTNSQGIYTNAASKVGRMIITNNISKNHTRHGIEPVYAGTTEKIDSIVANNICENCSSTGIYVNTEADGVVIANNIIESCSGGGPNGYTLDGGISMLGDGVKICVGNYINNSGKTTSGVTRTIDPPTANNPLNVVAIRASSGNGGVISNNIIKGSTGNGIEITIAIDNQIISNNQIAGCVNAGIYISAVNNGGLSIIDANVIDEESGDGYGIWHRGSSVVDQCVITNNVIKGAKSSTAKSGIRFEGQGIIGRVAQNRIDNFDVALDVQSEDLANRLGDACIFDGNEILNSTQGFVFLSSLADFGFYTNFVYAGNGTNVVDVYARDTVLPAVSVAPVKLFYRNAQPAAGTWARGDRVINITPTAGQPKSWVCTVAGTPGTWVSEGNL